MRNKIIFSMLAVLALSSCGTVGITKRYHNRGFHIDFGRGGESTDAVAAKREKRKSNPSADNQQSSSTVQSNADADSDAEDFSVTAIAETDGTAPSATVESFAETTNSGSSTTDHIKKENGKHTPKTGLLGQVKRVSKIKQAVKASSGADVPDDSVMWILYLILCFVLPPLAYYLIRRETDTLFWICLICFLLWGSWFFGFSYGLLGLISVIIALLALLGS